jgi:hypothetical protein
MLRIPQCLYNRLESGGKVVTLLSDIIFPLWYSFLLEDEQIPGPSAARMIRYIDKKSLTSWDLERATFQHAEYCLNHYATAGPQYLSYITFGPISPYTTTFLLVPVVHWDKFQTCSEPYAMSRKRERERDQTNRWTVCQCSLQHSKPTLLPVHETSCCTFTFCAEKPAATHTFSQTYRCKTAIRKLPQASPDIISIAVSILVFETAIEYWVRCDYFVRGWKSVELGRMPTHLLHAFFCSAHFRSWRWRRYFLPTVRSHTSKAIYPRRRQHS